jgi:hypothetical protein
MSELSPTVVSASAGTRFPFISLQKAIDRAKQLFDADQKGREMTLSASFAVWEYSDKSSGGFQTVAALKMYGLIKDSTGGDTRRIALSEPALRYFRDERETEKKRIAKEFALKPKLIAALWKDWHATPPADAIARSHLKAERGLTDQGARTLLAIYKENLAFAELKGDDKIEPASSEDAEGTVLHTPPGDYELPKMQPTAQVKMMPNERVVFTEEVVPNQYLKLIASGELDDVLLEALEDYVKRQRKRLNQAVLQSKIDKSEAFE